MFPTEKTGVVDGPFSMKTKLLTSEKISFGVTMTACGKRKRQEWLKLAPPRQGWVAIFNHDVTKRVLFPEGGLDHKRDEQELLDENKRKSWYLQMQLSENNADTS